ncbi:hypothetical protein LJC36_00110 [Desulfovibrio sp. OttesenSCG-928-C14]|nr:hypothetical protein [Desulfovibrio sp. OttesenSCG-928-C14]
MPDCTTPDFPKIREQFRALGVGLIAVHCLGLMVPGTRTDVGYLCDLLDDLFGFQIAELFSDQSFADFQDTHAGFYTLAENILQRKHGFLLEAQSVLQMDSATNEVGRLTDHNAPRTHRTFFVYGDTMDEAVAKILRGARQFMLEERNKQRRAQGLAERSFEDEWDE